MSGIKDNKIDSTDTQGKKVADVPGDSLSGTVLENKQVFDKLTELVITKFNSALDYLYSKNIDGGVTSTTATTTANGLMSSTDKTKLNNLTTSTATTSAAGYMSAADKTKLNGIADGATKNTTTATTSANGLMSSTDKTKLNALCDFDSLFSVEAVSIGLLSGGTYSGTKSISKSNYYPLGICGWYTSSDHGNVRILVNTLYLSSQSVGSGVITFNTKNVGDTFQTSESLVARVLWIKAAV